jgi:putative toxin-antitoxin system antitoxin component (TIGR02293 family)
MTTAEHVIDLLGGSKAFRGRAVPTPAELRHHVKAGLPYQSLETVLERLNLSLREAAAVLHVPLRTLARRRLSRRLGANESDRLYRLARIAAQAVTTLGNEDAAAAWLRQPNRSLGGDAPIEILDTDLGARQVDDVLGRIEYGVIG